MANLIEAALAEGKKTFLNVGCSHKDSAPLPSWLLSGEWKEIRLDIDPAVEPDLVASITDMTAVVADGTIDAVWSSHNIEHLFPHEVELALREFARVLKPEGVAFIYVPDLQAIAGMLAEGRILGTAYTSPVGPIRPLDMIYGHAESIAQGRTFMAHRTGFTMISLRRALAQAGLIHNNIEQDGFQLVAVAAKVNIWHGAV